MAAGRAAVRPGRSPRRQPVAQGGQRADRHRLDRLAVDLGAAGEGDGQRVHRVEQAQFALAGLADERRVDQHPLVPQPHDRAVGLGERVHLALGERVAAERQLPAELEQFLALEEAGAVRGRAGRGAYHRGRAQVLRQVAGPVHGDPGRAEPGRGDAEQVGQLLLGQGEDVGDVLLGQPVQRRPDAGRAAHGESGVHAGAGPERRVRLARPQRGGVDDEGGVGEAVHLDDGRARAAGAARSSSKSSCADRSRRSEIRTPASMPAATSAAQSRASRQPLRLARGEGLPGGVRRGRGAGQGVGDRVQEGAHQRLRLGQPQRARGRAAGPRGPVRQGRGDRPQVRDVVRVERSGPPGVVARRRQAGQQPAARDQAQRVQCGRAPAGGGGVGGGVAPGPDEQRQGLADRQRQRGDGPSCGLRRRAVVRP